MRKFYLVLFLALHFVSPAWCDDALRQSAVPSSNSPFDIPYTKYRLPNGLTVVIQENHRDPIVHVEVMYHVGSAREDKGKSGFAHLFEHMMFQGSKHIPYNDHFRIITEAGGRMNGSASRDRTNYWQTVPKNQLETALWLESDRMGFFLDGISQEKFEVQRATVKNEKGQNIDNRPYGRVWETLDRMLYPETHPYSWQTIGNVEDLDRVTADDLRQFFSRWYGPNNAVLTIVGDVDPSETMALVAKYFAAISTGPDVVPAPKWVPTLSQNSYQSIEDVLIEQPRLIRAYPVPFRFHHDEPSLDALAVILGAGPNSLLYQALVKTRLASDVSVSDYTSELAGEFIIEITPYTGVSLSTVNEVLQTVLTDVAKNGVSDDQLERFKTKYTVDTMHRLEDIEEKSSLLSINQLLMNDPGFLNTESARYLAVTTASVQAALLRYIDDRPFAQLCVVPKGQLGVGKAPSLNDDTVPFLIPATAMDVDRTKRPTSDAAAFVPILPMWTMDSNGISVIGLTDTSNDLVRIQLIIPGGAALAYQHGFSTSVPDLLSRMLAQDTADMSLEAVNAELERLGGQVGVVIGAEDTTITLTGLKNNLSKIVDLASQRVYSPGFKVADFERVQSEALEDIRMHRSDNDWIADHVAAVEGYGPTHPLGRFGCGSSDDIKSTTLDDLRRLWRMIITGNGMSAAVVGHVTRSEVTQWLSPFHIDPDNSPTLNVAVARQDAPTSSIVVVDVPGSTQSQLRCIFPAPAYSAIGAFYPAQLFNFPVGGNFNSRINMKLREERGVSYGAYSMIQTSLFPGYFELGSAVKWDATGLAVHDILDIIHTLSTSGITDAEVSMMKHAVLQRDALRYADPNSKLELLSRIQRFQLPPDFLSTRARYTQSVTTAELNRHGMPYFAQPVTVIIVGDATKIMPQLSENGLPVRVVTVSQYFQ